MYGADCCPEIETNLKDRVLDTAVDQPDLYSPNSRQGVNCSSFSCSEGYALIYNATYEGCEDDMCSASQCCDKACASYDCPSGFSLVEASNTTLCNNSRCTRRQCCERGETPPDYTLHTYGECRIYGQHSSALLCYESSVRVGDV